MSENGQKNSGKSSRAGSDLQGALFFLSPKPSARHFEVPAKGSQAGARGFWRGARGFSGWISRVSNQSPVWLQTHNPSGFCVASVKKCSPYYSEYVSALFTRRAFNPFGLRVFASTRVWLDTLKEDFQHA